MSRLLHGAFYNVPYHIDVIKPMKPIYPLQIVVKNSVSKREFLQSPLNVNTVDLLTSHETQASNDLSRSLKDFFNGLIPTKFCHIPPSGCPVDHLISLVMIDHY